jgi:hypothetical protein
MDAYGDAMEDAMDAYGDALNSYGGYGFW